MTLGFVNGLACSDPCPRLRGQAGAKPLSRLFPPNSLLLLVRRRASLGGALVLGHALCRGIVAAARRWRVHALWARQPLPAAGEAFQ